MFDFGFFAALNGGFPQSPNGMTYNEMREYDAGFSLGWEIRDALEAM